MTTYPPKKGASAQEIAETVEAILQEATLEEKVAMMSGRGFFKQFKESDNRWGGHPYRAGGGCERLGVPALYFTDGPRGVARGSSTCFPCSMARGATFDRDLERRIGEVMGIEARAQDCTLSGAVCINLLRHPAWGRAQETYGEDPFHVGEMGASLATGIQTHNVVATVKHFAVNSIENARFKVDVKVNPRTLREVYLPHFKRALDVGCASVMSAYNKLNGEFCGQNRVLLTDILRDEWGFEGFVHSDWVAGVHAPYGAAAGLDVENPEPLVFGDKLVDAVNKGAVEPEVIDRACRRILTTIYQFASREDPYEAYTMDMVATEDHRAVAKEAALKSMVMLKNDTVLPLKADKLTKVAVMGRLAKLENTGDHGSSRVRPTHVVTAYEGLEQALPAQTELLYSDETDLDAVKTAAGQADAVIVVVGYTADEEGEYVPGDIALDPNVQAAVEDAVDGRPGSNFAVGGDRRFLTLPSAQVSMIKAACAQNDNVTVVMISGSAVVIADWVAQAGAVLHGFYMGMEGGHALADLLLGKVSPSGKLPFTVPEKEEDLPFFDMDADEIDYGPYHGYTMFDRDQNKTPAFPFGFGLTYTSFDYRALKPYKAPDGVRVSVSVRNAGQVRAEEVVQVYAGFPGTAVERPVKLLREFARVQLEPGQIQTLHFHIPFADLAYWHEADKSWVLERGAHRIYAGGSSREEDLLVTQVAL